MQTGLRRGIMKMLGLYQTQQQELDPFSNLNSEVKQLILVKNAENTKFDSLVVVTGNSFQ